MKLSLLSCNAQRPDRRVISNYIQEISFNLDSNLSNELTDILLEGDAIEVEIEDKNSGSVLRTLRKLGIDYEII
jgi:hypothetical protein